jgi:hypothetical protein
MAGATKRERHRAMRDRTMKSRMSTFGCLEDGNGVDSDGLDERGTFSAWNNLTICQPSAEVYDGDSTRIIHRLDWKSTR